MTDEERKAYNRLKTAQYRASLSEEYRHEILKQRRLTRAANIAASLAKERASRAAHRAAINARAQARRHGPQADEIRAKARANYAAKADHYKNYRTTHRETIKQTKRAWVVRNDGAMRAVRFKRIAAERQALPAWANLAAIKSIYEEAARRSRETGIKHEVDHIIPIQSPVVCGLHWEANMQILTKAENRRKSNGFTPHIGQPRSPCDEAPS